jgi:hypothetical protein
MGRPIKKTFFGNLNTPPVGGEGFANVFVVNSGTFYSTSTAVTWTASAPQLSGGVAASGTAVIGTGGDAGKVMALNISNAGAGYTSTASVTVTLSPATTGTGVGVVVALTNTTPNALAVTAFLTTGSSAVLADIVKQEASRRYLVKNAQGVGQCKLVTAAPAAGEMTLIATDSNGSTYYVKKLTAFRAVLVRNTMVGSYEFADNQAAGWTLGSASTGIVSLASN